ncbi:Site-specific recombinase, phage integrase family protein, partial [Pseudomonas syringae pv. daphniphylli]
KISDSLSAAAVRALAPEKASFHMPQDPCTDQDARIVSQPSLPDVNNPLRLYLDRLAPSSRLTMTYVLQDAADRLGMADVDIHDIPWHTLQPGHVTALVATLREDDYAPNTTSLYVNAIRGVMDVHPALITANYAKHFKELATINEDYVVSVVEKMASSGLTQEAALRLIRREVDSVSKTEARQMNKSAVVGVGTLRILGDRVEVKCAKGIDATKLAQEFVTFLHSLDKAQIQEADESATDQ